MNESLSAALGGLATKLLPAALGALIMIAVDVPRTKREWFLRIFVALACGWAFFEVSFDFFQTLSWLSFLKRGSADHQYAVRVFIGATSWWVMGAGAVILRKIRAKAADAVDVKKVV